MTPQTMADALRKNFLGNSPVWYKLTIISFLMTCALLEYFNKFGYGTELGVKVRAVLEEYDAEMTAKRTKQETVTLIIQDLVAVTLLLALGFHLAEPGVVGLLVIVLATAFNGVTEEHRIGHAFEECITIHSIALRVFCDCCRNRSPGSLQSRYPLGDVVQGQIAGGALLCCQRHSFHDQR